MAVLVLATALAQLTGRRPLFTRAALDALHSNPQVRHERAAGDLGYRPRPLSQTLYDTFEWFKEAGRLSCSLAPLPAEAT